MENKMKNSIVNSIVREAFVKKAKTTLNMEKLENIDLRKLNSAIKDEFNIDAPLEVVGINKSTGRGILKSDNLANKTGVLEPIYKKVIFNGEVYPGDDNDIMISLEFSWEHPRGSNGYSVGLGQLKDGFNDLNNVTRWQFRNDESNDGKYLDETRKRF